MADCRSLTSAAAPPLPLHYPARSPPPAWSRPARHLGHATRSSRCTAASPPPTCPEPGGSARCYWNGHGSSVTTRLKDAPLKRPGPHGPPVVRQQLAGFDLRPTPGKVGAVLPKQPAVTCPRAGWHQHVAEGIATERSVPSNHPAQGTGGRITAAAEILAERVDKGRVLPRLNDPRSRMSRTEPREAEQNHRTHWISRVFSPVGPSRAAPAARRNPPSCWRPMDCGGPRAARLSL